MRPLKIRGAPEPQYSRHPIPDEALRAYYRLVAPIMLPWVRERPLNLFRCERGRCFFQRNRSHPATEASFDPPIRLLPIRQKNGRVEDYLWVEDEAGLVACADTDAAEFHGWGSLVDDVERPDRIVIDLDPGEGVTFETVRNAAMQLRRSFEAVGLQSWPLLSGGKGIHVVVPLAPRAEWPHVQAFAELFCSTLAAADPERFTISLPKAERAGRIFLDHLRNHRTATAVLPYSARARHGAPIAAPVTWRELGRIDRSDRFGMTDVEELLDRAESAALRGWGRSDQMLPTF
jgi:bifunctional non-homologous end joining protein LigD